MAIFNLVLRPWFVILLLVTGAIIGGAEILRPHTAPREAMEMDLKNQQLASQIQREGQVAAIEAKQALERMTAETRAAIAVTDANAAAEIARIQEAQRVEVERNNQRLADEVNWTSVKMAIVLAIGLALSVAIGAGLTKLSFRLPDIIWRPAPVPVPVPVPVPSERRNSRSWSDQAYRRWRIRQAKEHEWQYRNEQLRCTSPPGSATHSNASRLLPGGETIYPN
jgi:hypothetical protein